jgi:hypothetical protein
MLMFAHPPPPPPPPPPGPAPPPPHPPLAPHAPTPDVLVDGKPCPATSRDKNGRATAKERVGERRESKVK